jgi:two-component system NtrC family sensor kinase
MASALGPGTSRTAVSSDDSFQAVLLELSGAAAQGLEFEAMLHLFCRLTQEHFQASTVFCWLVKGRELFGLDGAGSDVSTYLGKRITLNANTYSGRAVRDRVTVLVNDVPAQPDEIAKQRPVESILVVPLVLGGPVIGVIVFSHETRKHFFTEEMAGKAQILATILGNLIETARLNRASREERRRAEALTRCARALHSKMELEAVSEELVHGVCDLMGAAATALILAADQKFRVASVFSPDGKCADKIRSHHLNGLCAAAADLAQRAVATRDIVAMGPSAVLDPILHPAERQMVAVPLFTKSSTAVLFVYPPEGRELDDQELALLRTVAGFGAMAVSNAELLAKSEAQARELQQLLSITSELSSTDDLDRFLERFVLCAAEFLGFARSCIALVESDGSGSIRWAAEAGVPHPLVMKVPERLQKNVIEGKKVFWTDDVLKLPNLDVDFAERFQLRQALVAPLLGSQGQCLGLLAVLDRKDGHGIQQEDIRRAEALAAAVATALERIRNLHLAVQHQHRGEELVHLALEVGSSIRLPQLVRALTDRAAGLIQASAAVLLLARGSSLETVYAFNSPSLDDKSLAHRFNICLTDLMARSGDPIRFGSAVELLGAGVAEALGWSNATIVRLSSADNQMIGVLCLATAARELTAEERSLLQAITAHASVALDNSRLFTRIAQSNNQWVEIFDAITDFIVVHDQTDQVLRVNRGMAEFIGVRPAELVGVSMRALMALAQETSSESCPFCRSRSELTDEYLHPVLDRTYLVSTSRIHGALEEGTQTIHVLKDITDRREAERRYRELFDNIQEGLFFTTPEGRFIEVNDALVRMLGYESREELLQADIYKDIYPKPSDRAKFTEALESNGILRNYQEVLRRKDGAAIYTLQNAFAVRDAQGKVTQYRGLTLDITELKNFQSELQRQRDFNASILNNTQSLIVVSDTAGLISFANRRCYELGGFAPGELVGRPLINLILPEKRDVLRASLERSLEGEQVANIELPLMLAQHGAGQFSVNLSPMRDDNGQVSSIVAVLTDITDAAILQAKLMHTEKMAAVGQLVSGVAHEVNNPLTAILGFADLLSEQEDVPEDARRDLQVIIQEAQRTKQIVQNLLSFARQMPAQRQPVQLNAILRRTLQLRAYDFANHGIKLFEDLHEPMPDVVGDPHQLQQVFLNILNNAYDAVRDTNRPGVVEVHSHVRQGNVEVTFADTGTGITAPERIFDPFYTTKEVGKGTGLGLSICYGIVREHGGDIVASNRNDVQGAMFAVRLPAMIIARTAAEAD